MSKSVSVCMSIFNQAHIMELIMKGLLNNISDNVKEIIINFDGCTDNSETVVKKALESTKIKTIFHHSPNVWEVRANNICFKSSSCDYILTLQDDMALTEKDFDKRMMMPFFEVDNLLGVTARNAQDERIKEGWIDCYNVAGEDVDSPRTHLYIRDVIVRGPVMFDHKILKSLGYLNEDFAPIYGDDYDLSFRAWRKGYMVGAYRAGFYSPTHWGKTRQHNAEQRNTWLSTTRRNEQMLMERHNDLINGEKHSKDIPIKQEVA